MFLLRWLIWPKGCVNISNHNNYCQSKLYMPINGDTGYTQMLSCPISKTDFSFQAELLTHLTSVPLICATLVRVHQPLSHAHTAGRVCTKSGQRGSRGLEVITSFHLIFFPFHAIAMDSEKTNVSFLNPAVDHTTPNPHCDPDPGRWSLTQGLQILWDHVSTLH